MSLNVGELTGYLDLDAGPFEKGIGVAFDKLGGKKWQVAGAAAGVAAATALAGGLMMAVDAQGAVNKVSASLGLTKDESAKAGTAAGKLYANNYGDSMEDVTGAVEAVMSSIKGMRGASAEDIQAMTANVMNLASAFEIDVSKAAQVAGQMITTGLAKDGANAADLLTVALQKVPKGVREDVLDAVDEYGPFFQQLGISGEKAMGMLVDASQKGMYGVDKTGDALKEFTIRSTDMSKASGAAYQALGMDQEAMTKKILAGGSSAKDAFGQIVIGLKNMKDPAAQSQAALALFGTPLEDIGTKDIPKFLAQLGNMNNGLGDVGGAANKMGDTLNSGASAGIDTFVRAAQQSLSDLGAKVLPILTPILQNLSQWAPVIGPIVLVLGAFAAAIGIANAAVIAFGVIKIVVEAVKAWTTAQWGLNIAMNANVIALVVIAIVALIAIIVALVMNWDTVVKFLTDTWNGFISWFTGVMDGFFGWWNGVWAGFAGFIRDVWNGFVGWIKGIWDGFVGWIRAGLIAYGMFWLTTWNNVSKTVTDVWNGFIGWIQGIWNGFINWIRAALIAYGTFWLGVWRGAGKVISDVWNGIVNWVKSAINNVSTTIRVVSAAIGIVWNNFWGSFGRTVSSIWGGITGGVRTGIDTVVGFVRGLPGQVLGFFSGAGSWLLDAGRHIIEGFLNGLKNAFEGVKNFVGGIGQWIADHKGPKAYDLALLVPAGGWIMEGLGKGISKSMPSLKSTLDDVSWMIQNGIDPELTATGKYAFTGTQPLAASVGQQGPQTVINNNMTVNPSEGMSEEKLGRIAAEELEWSARR